MDAVKALELAQKVWRTGVSYCENGNPAAGENYKERARDIAAKHGIDWSRVEAPASTRTTPPGFNMDDFINDLFRRRQGQSGSRRATYEEARQTQREDFQPWTRGPKDTTKNWFSRGYNAGRHGRPGEFPGRADFDLKDAYKRGYAAGQRKSAGSSKRETGDLKDSRKNIFSRGYYAGRNGKGRASMPEDLSYVEQDWWLDGYEAGKKKRYSEAYGG